MSGVLRKLPILRGLDSHMIIFSYMSFQSLEFTIYIYIYIYIYNLCSSRITPKGGMNEWILKIIIQELNISILINPPRE